jgi:hypothetical protein
MGGLWLHPIKLVDGFWVKIFASAIDGLFTRILKVNRKVFVYLDGSKITN